MLLYIPTDGFNTLEAAFQEARLLLETLVFLGPGFPSEPRRGVGAVKFIRNSDGDLEFIFLKSGTTAADEE